ncbi:MAG: hypothetical protein ABR557_14255, partial [Pyrinomonadaceae bacterium]
VQLLPSDSENRYALCMDHEMPTAAIMIKANWTPVIKYDSVLPRVARLNHKDTNALTLKNQA